MAVYVGGHHWFEVFKLTLLKKVEYSHLKHGYLSVVCHLYNADSVRGFAKFQESQKSQKKWMGLTPPTHHTIHNLFLFVENPSLTWTELLNSNHNVERGSSPVECRTRKQVSPGSNPLFVTISKIGHFRSLH